MTSGKNSTIVGLAGPSGAGKTTLAFALKEKIGDENCSVLSLDCYYSDLSGTPPHLRGAWNFDEPAALDAALLEEHLRALREGRAIDGPQYDFSIHARLPATERIAPRRWVVVEGLFLLHWPSVRALIDLPVYVDLSQDLALARRLARDTQERGRTEREAVAQFRKHVIPAAKRYVAPSAQYAQLVVDGSQAMEVNVERLLRAMNEQFGVDQFRAGIEAGGVDA